MSRNSLYFIRPDWAGDLDSAHEAVTKTFYGHGPRDIHLGIELWRLARNQDGARELEDLLDRAFGRDIAHLESVDIREMIENIARLECELEASIIDRRGLVADTKLPELRARAAEVGAQTIATNIAEERGELAKYGIGESLSKVAALRDLLREALAEGMHVALDYS